MVHRQDYGGSLTHFVVIQVAPVTARRPGGRGKIARRSNADTAEHWDRWKLQFDSLASGVAQSDRVMLQVDIPPLLVGLSANDAIRSGLVGIDPLDCLGFECVQAQAEARIAPVAIQADFPQ